MTKLSILINMKIYDNFYCTKTTLKFCIAGIFIPGFTAFGLLGLQQGIQATGVSCTASWSLLWTLTIIGSLLAPFAFGRVLWIKWNKNPALLLKSLWLMKALTVFNILEYSFIQCSFAATMTSGETLCYGSSGQNGLEFVFTGWYALPVLVILSLVLDWMKRRVSEEVEVEA